MGYFLGSFIQDIFLPVGIGVGMGVLSICIGYRENLYLQKYLVAGLLIAISCAYYVFYIGSYNNTHTLPPREAVLTLKVTHVFAQNKEKHSVLGTAIVDNAPLHLKEFIGQRLYFQARNPSDLPIVKTQRIECRGVLSDLRQQTDQTDFSQYLLRSEIHLQYTRGVVLQEVSPANNLFRFFDKQNTHFENILLLNGSEKQSLPSDATAVYIAMLLGKKAYLSQEQKDIFKQSGTLHLFAISGLHVGVVAGCLAYILNFFRVPRKISAIIGLGCLLYYVLATGASPSAMRAYLMVFFFWGAYFFSRKPAPFSALLASALCTLIWNPLQLWNIGFQLSYLVVAAILLYGLPLYESINQKTGQENDIWWLNNKITHGAIGLLTISIAATLGSAPLSMLYFHITTPGGILANLVLMPMASIVIIAGCVSLIIGTLNIPVLSYWLGSLINICAIQVITAMEKIIPWSFHIKGLFFAVEKANTLLSIGFLVLLLGWMLWGHLRNRLQKFRYYAIPVISLTLITVYEVARNGA